MPGSGASAPLRQAILFVREHARSVCQFDDAERLPLNLPAMKRPNVLYIMTDQQRSDTIAALGNPHIHTPNFDRLVKRGVSFTRAYSPTPVCVPARYIVRTGCLPAKTGSYTNGQPKGVEGQADSVTGRCGKYLAQTMKDLGYRTFGVGKFHTVPWREDIGYETQFYSEELYGSQEVRDSDHYAKFIADSGNFEHIEQIQGERTEMYYMPQTSPFSPEMTVESWAADRAIEQLEVEDERPYFGFVSFIGPHPPLAPPVPFNRMYNPDRMPAPIIGDEEIDLMDEHLPFMNYLIWADDVDPLRTGACRARYYGELSYIDWCLGRILDAVEARDDADNTVICFFADHGDHMGDHRSWQKESYFEQSAHVPFLVSWPSQLPADERREELVGLQDLFGIATTAAGEPETRDGIDVLGLIKGDAPPREHFVGYYGRPGSRQFKIMIRTGDWKYIYFANGGREQLFNLKMDPDEVRQLVDKEPGVAKRLRDVAVDVCREPAMKDALEGDDLRGYEFEARPLRRINQMAYECGATGFPENPGDAIADFVESYKKRNAKA